VDLTGKRLVAIGGAGLIGSHTVDVLREEDVAEIVVFDNFVRGSLENLSSALDDDRVTVFDAGGDIGHPDLLSAALDGAHGVFHFAALWLLQCHEFPQAAFDVNVAGTFNVMEACRRTGVDRVVYSSSASVYGEAVDEPMTEQHPYNNTTFYGATKIAGEHMFRAHHHRYGLDYAGLRYFNVYGPRQDYKGAYIAVIMKMLDSIDQGRRPVVYGDGSQAYDFVFVKDCARANVAAMKADAVDRFYNVCTGVKTSISTLARMLLDLTGSDLEIEFRPEVESFVKNRIGSPDAAIEELDFKAQTTLEEGLAELIEWRSAHQHRVQP